MDDYNKSLVWFVVLGAGVGSSTLAKIDDACSILYLFSVDLHVTIESHEMVYFFGVLQRDARSNLCAL